MRTKIREFIAHPFVRASVVLQVGNVAGVFVQALAGVFIARILKPDLFGQYSVAISVASIATLLLGSGVQDAITPQVSRGWATGQRGPISAAFGFFAKFVLTAACATVLVVVCLPYVTSVLYHSHTLGRYAAVIVVASLISSTVFTLAQLSLQIAGRIAGLAAMTFADVVVRNTILLALIVSGLGLWGAVSGHLIGSVLMFAVSIIVFERLVARHSLLPGLRVLLREARTAPWRPLLTPTLWVIGDRNLAMLYGALPVAMVGLYASGSEVAYFKLALGYTLLGMSVLGPISTLLNVHFPTVQETQRAQLRRSFIRMTMYATALSMAVTAVALVIAPIVFRILYGSVYLPAIPYVYGFGIFGALYGLGVGLGPMWRAVNRVHVSVVINLITLGIGVPLGIWFITHWHIWGAVAIVTLWYTVSHLASLVWLLRALERDDVAPMGSVG